MKTSSLITISLPDSGTVNWILITLLSLHLAFDILTWLSPTALRHLAAWAIARAAGLDAMKEVMHEVAAEERTRLKLQDSDVPLKVKILSKTFEIE